MEQPTSEHLAAVKYVLRYISGTLNFGVTYERGRGALKLIGYSDADLAGDVDDRKSTTVMIPLSDRVPGRASVPSRTRVDGGGRSGTL